MGKTETENATETTKFTYTQQIKAVLMNESASCSSLFQQ